MKTTPSRQDSGTENSMHCRELPETRGLATPPLPDLTNHNRFSLRNLKVATWHKETATAYPHQYTQPPIPLELCESQICQFSSFSMPHTTRQLQAKTNLQQGKVAVVVPSFARTSSASDQLTEAVTELLHQTRLPDQLIIVDDCSPTPYTMPANLDGKLPKVHNLTPT